MTTQDQLRDIAKHHGELAYMVCSAAADELDALHKRIAELEGCCCGTDANGSPVPCPVHGEGK